MKRFLFFSALALSSTIAISQSCPDPSESQFIPELHPPKVVRVAFHVIHETNVSDSSNIPNTTAGDNWWDDRVIEINKMLKTLPSPNYSHWVRAVNDSKFQIVKHDVYHHVDFAKYHSGASVEDFYTDLVLNGTNPNTGNPFSNTEKNEVLHCFYYYGGTNTVGGSVASGYPDRRGIRFTGRKYVFDDNSGDGSVCHNLDDNFIHELGHVFGLHHNQKNSTEASQQCWACDAVKPNVDCINFYWNNYPPGVSVPNNFMAKGELTPFGRSFSYCQARRMAFTASEHFNTSNQYKDLHNICTEPTFYDAVLSEVNPETGDGEYTLEYPIIAKGNITIEYGITLIVKCEIQMPGGKAIIVKPGGKLVIDGGKVTSNPLDNWWSGIYVEGDVSQSQSSFDANGFRYQGEVEVINGGTIENALIGIESRNSNGIVKVNDGKFYNNVRAILISGNQNFVPLVPLTQWIPIPSLSYIKNSLFVLNSSWVIPHKSPTNQIDIHYVDRINIEDNIIRSYLPFTNWDRGFPASGPIGINVYSSSCSLKNNGIWGFYAGVRTGSIYLDQVSITQNSFQENVIGVQGLSSDYLYIVDNHHEKDYIGCLMDNSKGFKVSNNNYRLCAYGLNANNTRSFSNEFYKNKFDDSFIGFIGTASNSYSNTGLKLKCNDFAFNNSSYTDVYVRSGEINRYQGTCNYSSPENANLPAGNKFSKVGSPSASDIHLISGYPSTLVYTFHNATSAPEYEPTYFSTPVRLNPCFVDPLSGSCPDKYLVQGGVIDYDTKQADFAVKFTSSSGSIGQLQDNYEDLLDGGNTTGLLSFVNNSSNTASQVYDELELNFPYLSDEVLQATISRANSLSSTDLYSMLSWCSPLTHSIYVNAINTGILTNQQIDDLEELQTGLSSRDELELEMSDYEHDADVSLSEIVQLNLFDTVPLDPNDTILKYLLYDNSNSSKESMVKMHWKLGDAGSADPIISDLQSTDYSSGLADVFDKLQSYEITVELLESLAADSIWLDSICHDSTHSGQALAKLLMYNINNSEYPLPSVLLEEFVDWDDWLEYVASQEYPSVEDSNSTSDAESNINTPFENQPIKLYPNPNSGEFVLVIPLGEGMRKLEVKIRKHDGQVVFQEKLKENQGEYFLGTNLRNGLYFLELLSQDVQLFNHKVVILNE